MIKVWGRANSSNVQKVVWTLAELGVPYVRVDVGGPFGGTATPEYRAMNPLGVVPSLEDGDLRLFESNVICRYIVGAHGTGSPLYPQDPAGRARVEMWMDFQQTAHNRPMSVVFQGLIRIAPEQRDMAAITAAIAELGKIYGILDARLAQHAHIAGEDFTLADIVYGMHVHRWLNIDIPGRPELAYLRAWYDRLCARPAFAQHVVGIPIT
jgi:glutathione S-transferase